MIKTKPPSKSWDGNQGTYLVFPTFVSFMLVLMATLSIPIVPGLSVANVDSGGNGTVQFGAWGWCVQGVANLT